MSSTTAGDRYARLPLPGRPRYTAHAPAPAHHLGLLWEDRLRHGLPATRRFPRLRVLATPMARPVVGTVARALPGRPDVELDRLLDDLRSGWSELAAASTHLPAAAPRLRVLAMDTTMGRLSFVFGDGPSPLIVGRTPSETGASSVHGEVRALQRLTDTGVAPRHLGRLGTTELQEGLPGRQMHLLPLQDHPVAWTHELEAALEGLTRVSRATAVDEPPAEELPTLTDMLSTVAAPSARSRRLGAQALRRVAAHPVSVLRHGDLSPQNVICRDSTLSGIVDWERAVPRGVAGFDPLHLAVSWLEKGIGSGTRRWSPDPVARRFRQCWAGDFRDHVLAHVHDALEAAGIDADAGHVEVAFFARRFARRRLRPGDYTRTDLDIAASALEHVCKP